MEIVFATTMTQCYLDLVSADSGMYELYYEVRVSRKIRIKQQTSLHIGSLPP